MTLLYYSIILMVLAVFAVLMFGLGTFTRGGDFNRKYANVIMRWRIILQALAVALIISYTLLYQGIGG